MSLFRQLILKTKLYRLRDFIMISDYRRVLLDRLSCSLFQKLYPDIRYLGIANDSGTAIMFLKDNVITPYSLAVGSFQQTDVLRVTELCQKNNFRLGEIFLDVGANIGTSSIYALRSGAFSRAICIEPAPSNLPVLRSNLLMNHFETRATVVPMAVSHGPGEMALALSPDNCGDHRISLTPGREDAKVRVDALDNILEHAGIRPKEVSLVWVDTQGHEGFVLGGASKLIDAGIPFCIEFWPFAAQAVDGFEPLLDLIEKRFAAFTDLGSEDWMVKQPSSSIRSWAKKFEGTTLHTDLFLFPRT